MQDLGAILQSRRDGVEFRERLTKHPKLCVTAGGLHAPIKIHACSVEQEACQTLEKQRLQFGETPLEEAQGSLDRRRFGHINTGELQRLQREF